MKTTVAYNMKQAQKNMNNMLMDMCERAHVNEFHSEIARNCIYEGMEIQWQRVN